MRNIVLVILIFLFFSGCGGYYSEYYHAVSMASPEKINRRTEPYVIVQPDLPSLTEINEAGYILLGYSSFSSTFCEAVSLECAAYTGKEYGADLIIVKTPVLFSSVNQIINVTHTATVNTNTSFSGDGKIIGTYSNGMFNYSGQSHSQSNITYTVPENVTYNYYLFGAYFLLKKTNEK